MLYSVVLEDSSNIVREETLSDELTKLTKQEFYLNINNWQQSTVGTGASKKNIVKSSVRKSEYCEIYCDFISSNNVENCVKQSVSEEYQPFIKPLFCENDASNVLDVSDANEKTCWTLLKYLPGDFFAKHKDGVSSKEHVGTILIIPPKAVCPYEGGELVIYGDFATKKHNTIECEITADQTKWTIICMNVNIYHEVKPTISGTRFVFKNKIMVDHLT